MMDLNPDIEVGKEYVLDKDFNNSSIVKVTEVGRIYAVVTDGESTWRTMKDRLSKIEEQS